LRPLVLTWLSLLLLLSFTAMYLALTSISSRALVETRVDDARALGRLLAAQAFYEVSDRDGPNGSQDPSRGELGKKLRELAVRGSAKAIVLVGKNGNVIASYGEPGDISELRGHRVGTAAAAADTLAEGVWRIRENLDVALPGSNAQAGWTSLVRVEVRIPSKRVGSVSQTFALYMGFLAAALLLFAYIALTLTVARPVDALRRSADRVARGARALDVPQRGGRELLELGDHLQTMTSQLHEQAASLREKIAELEATTKNLRSTQNQLAGSDRLASVGRLAAGVAHEIGNPITAIIGLQEILLDGGLDPETDRDFLKRMRNETERAHRIVRDLLAFARPEEQAETREPGNVEEAITTVAALVAPQKDMRDIRMVVGSLDALPRVRLPTSQLTQVLLNLVMNARDALLSEKEPSPASRSPANANNLADKTIAIRCTKGPSSAVTIEIVDNGPGMPPSIRAKACDPFFTTKDVGRGTGLGLAVCKGLVEASRGELRLEEGDNGRGTRVVIVLPSAEDEAS
jgi:two-component system, NtrC family, sensor kinase